MDAADAFILISPEYNHSYSPALKNALDYLGQEWWRKPVGIVSYGGVSGGTRGVTALEPVLAILGLIRAGAQVEIPFAGGQIADGVFTPNHKETVVLGKQLDELAVLSEGLKQLQTR